MRKSSFSGLMPPAVLLLMIAIGLGVAFSAPVPAESPSAGPRLTVTITNTQDVATPAPFQQNITFDPALYSQYEAPNLGNIRFMMNGTLLHAWLEGYSGEPSGGSANEATKATVWVNLPNGIPARSSVTITMVFESTSTNFDGVYWGEAPQLSPTYGEYDNGQYVFNFYYNFAGTSLPSGLTEVVMSSPTGATGSYAVDNGITINSTGATSFWQGNYMITLVYLNKPVTLPEVFQVVAYSLTGKSLTTWSQAGLLYQNQITAKSAENGEVDFQITSGAGYNFNWQSGTSYVAPSDGWTSWLKIGYPAVLSLEALSPSAIGAFYANHTTSLELMHEVGPFVAPTNATTKGYIGLYAASLGSGTVSAKFGVFLGRAAPPNGVMPAVKVGELLTLHTVTVQESGLPVGTSWSLILNGIKMTTSSTQVQVYEFPGTYSYSVIAPTGYSASPQSGSITVSNESITLPIAFSVLKYPVTFEETGLPPGTSWSVTLNGATIAGQRFFITSNVTAPTANLSVPLGSYTYTITLPSGYRTTNSTGVLKVTGSKLLSIHASTVTPVLEYVAIIVIIVIVALGLYLALARSKKQPSGKGPSSKRRGAGVQSKFFSFLQRIVSIRFAGARHELFSRPLRKNLGSKS